MNKRNVKHSSINSLQEKTDEDVSEEEYVQYEDYGKEHIYENYDQEKADKKAERIVDEQRKNAEILANENFKKVYEEYDVNYNVYGARYNDYSNSHRSNRERILRRLSKKKSWIIFIVVILSIGGIVIGLSVHFTALSQGISLRQSIILELFIFNHTVNED